MSPDASFEQSARNAVALDTARRDVEAERQRREAEQRQRDRWNALDYEGQAYGKTPTPVAEHTAKLFSGKGSAVNAIVKRNALLPKPSAPAAPDPAQLGLADVEYAMWASANHPANEFSGLGADGAPLPKGISGTVSAENARLAQALAKTNDLSAFAQTQADALRLGGAQALTEFADLTRQLDTVKPGHGRKLTQSMINLVGAAPLDTEMQKALEAADLELEKALQHGGPSANAKGVQVAFLDGSKSFGEIMFDGANSTVRIFRDEYDGTAAKRREAQRKEEERKKKEEEKNTQQYEKYMRSFYPGYTHNDDNRYAPYNNTMPPEDRKKMAKEILTIAGKEGAGGAAKIAGAGATISKDKRRNLLSDPRDWAGDQLIDSAQEDKKHWGYKDENLWDVIRELFR